MMKEIIKAQKKIKEILIDGTINHEPFHWFVDQLGMVQLYDKGLPLHIVLGIIKEYMSDADERERIKKMNGDSEENIRQLYAELEANWKDEYDRKN
tara:strand:- start:128 stop:415 length:288 start_codon:yes stop_codon:yes gene_type:complete